MFLICDSGPVRKDSGRLNPAHPPTKQAAVPQSLHGCIGEGARAAQESEWRGGMQKCWELAAARGPQAAVLGLGGPVGQGKGGSTPISFTLLRRS